MRPRPAGWPGRARGARPGGLLDVLGALVGVGEVAEVDSVVVLGADVLLEVLDDVEGDAVGLAFGFVAVGGFDFFLGDDGEVCHCDDAVFAGEGVEAEGASESVELVGHVALLCEAVADFPEGAEAGVVGVGDLLVAESLVLGVESLVLGLEGGDLVGGECHGCFPFTICNLTITV